MLALLLSLTISRLQIAKNLSNFLGIENKQLPGFWKVPTTDLQKLLRISFKDVDIWNFEPFLIQTQMVSMDFPQCPPSSHAYKALPYWISKSSLD